MRCRRACRRAVRHEPGGKRRRQATHPVVPRSFGGRIRTPGRPQARQQDLTPWRTAPPGQRVPVSACLAQALRESSQCSQPVRKGRGARLASGRSNSPPHRCQIPSRERRVGAGYYQIARACLSLSPSGAGCRPGTGSHSAARWHEEPAEQTAVSVRATPVASSCHFFADSGRSAADYAPLQIVLTALSKRHSVTRSHAPGDRRWRAC